MKKRVNVKRSFFFFVVVFFIVNFVLLYVWYEFLIKATANEEYSKLKKEVDHEVETIQEQLLKNENIDIVSLFDYISNKYHLHLVLLDKDNNIVYNNTNGMKEKEYLISYIININDLPYLISIGKNNQINSHALIEQFIIYECFIILMLAIIGSIIANHGILKPINEIITDIKNYKFGHKPTKRPITTEIDYIQNEFVDLTEQLEKEHQEQNRIVSAISHDIKTPLTSILGYTDILIKKNKNLDETELNYIKKIYDKAINIKDIVNDFDDYLLANKDRTYTFYSINLNDLLKNIRFSYEDDLKDKNISLKIVNKCKNIYLKLDVGKINRVISNIISNSIRYLGDKGKIVIECLEEKDNVVLRFSDNGQGVPEDKLDRIFDPLFTTDKSRKISGLGLTISKEIIETHEGTIKAYNNKEGGLTIEIRLIKSFNNS